MIGLQDLLSACTAIFSKNAIASVSSAFDFLLSAEPPDSGPRPLIKMRE